MEDLDWTALDVPASSFAVSSAISSPALIANMESIITEGFSATKASWLVNQVAPAG